MAVSRPGEWRPGDRHGSFVGSRFGGAGCARMCQRSLIRATRPAPWRSEAKPHWVAGVFRVSPTRLTWRSAHLLRVISSITAAGC